MMMVFTLAALGCAIFTIYTLSLFFRYKSREMGILLVLGLPIKQMKKQIKMELLLCVIVSAVLGTLVAVSFAWGIWQLFKVILADTKEMILIFDMQTYLFSGLFILFIVISFLIMLNQYLKSSDMIDIVNKSRKTEVVKDVSKKYSLLGLILLVCGLFIGYLLPNFIIDVLKFYPPDIISLVGYIPAIFGVYFILLQRIIGRTKKDKNRYKNIISDNMMRFQGRQTVRNMLIITLLVSGAYFASFYVPTMLSSALVNFEMSKVDYAFNYRADQDIVKELDIRKLAENMDVVITDYIQQQTAILGVDGYSEVQEKTNLSVSYTIEYFELCRSGDFYRKVLIIC